MVNKLVKQACCTSFLVHVTFNLQHRLLLNEGFLDLREKWLASKLGLQTFPASELGMLVEFIKLIYIRVEAINTRIMDSFIKESISTFSNNDKPEKNMRTNNHWHL